MCISPSGLIAKDLRQNLYALFTQMKRTLVEESLGKEFKSGTL